MQEIVLTGSVAAVTGAGNGIGKAYALELAKRGVKVVVNDLGATIHGDGKDGSVAEQVVQEILAIGGEAVAHTGSVASEEDMQNMVELALSAWGRLDILVNNAGIGAKTELDPANPINRFGAVADWQKNFEVNLLGVLLPMRAAWAHFESQNYGRIINTASSSFFGTQGTGSYAASKGGVLAFTRVAANTYRHTGIKINAIMPIAGTRLFQMQGQNPYVTWINDHFDPAQVAAFLPVLCRPELEETGETFTVGGGRAARVLIQSTDGWWQEETSAEGFLANWGEVMAGQGARTVESGSADLRRYAEYFTDKGPYG